MSKLTIDNRLRLILIIVPLFFLSGIFLSRNLRLTGRTFPLVPVHEVFSVIFLFDSSVWSILLIISLGIMLIKPKREIIALTIILTIMLVLIDQMRLQPRVYIYFLALIPFLFYTKQKDGSIIMIYLQILLIGVYLRSGIHKLHPNFINTVYPEILYLLGLFNYSETAEAIKYTGLVIPFIEIAAALLLFNPKTRKTGVYIATITHVAILLFLGPLGTNQNSVIYPRNIAMIGLVRLSFFATTNKISFPKLSLNKQSRLIHWIFLFAIALPALNLIKLRDHYPSFSLYSGKSNDLYIRIHKDELHKVDRNISRHATLVETKNHKIIDAFHWSMADLNVPVYPEKRILQKVVDRFCNEYQLQSGFYYSYERPKGIRNIQDYSDQYFCR